MARAVVEVAADVFVATSRRDLTTSTIIVSGDQAMLVDPAWDPDELADLADLIEARGWHVTAGVATHAHHDHLLWHPRFGVAPRYTSPGTVTYANAHRHDLLAELGPQWPPELARTFADVTAAPSTTLPFPERIELVVHDAHAPGHSAVWLPERGVLLAGDMLSDVELPLPFAPDDLKAYLRGLHTLTPFVHRATTLVPGHGTPTNRPSTRLNADHAYLTAVINGDDPEDPRRAHSAMAEAHQKIKALAEAFGQSHH